MCDEGGVRTCHRTGATLRNRFSPSSVSFQAEPQAFGLVQQELLTSEPSHWLNTYASLRVVLAQLPRCLPFPPFSLILVSFLHANGPSS